MRVLVMESEVGAGREASERLGAAGHDVVRCRELGTAPFPCRALERGGCPLDGTPVDAALLVRRHARTAPTVLEQGVTCARKRHIPLVVAGQVACNPYERFAAVVSPGETDILEACSRAVTEPLVRHGEAATAEFRAVLDRRQMPAEQSRVVVRHRHGGLVATLEPETPIDRRTAAVAATRVLGALHDVDPTAPSVDIVVGGAGWDAEV